MATIMKLQEDVFYFLWMPHPENLTLKRYAQNATTEDGKALDTGAVYSAREAYTVEDTEYVLLLEDTSLQWMLFQAEEIGWELTGELSWVKTFHQSILDVRSAVDVACIHLSAMGVTPKLTDAD